jgi:hypothetical protein
MSPRRRSEVACLDQLLQGANKRADQERRCAKDEQWNRKEANEKAELEQRAEDERKQAEKQTLVPI